jgi:hypothetical protein
MRPSSEPIAGRFARSATLLITYATKLVGLASAFNQLLLHDSPKPLPLAVAAFMMAGAQFSEGAVLAVIDRLVDSPAPEPERKSERSH